MNTMEYIIKICYYFLLMFAIFYIAKRKYKSNNKFPIITIIFVSALYGVYSIICGKYPYVSDRLNFAFRFASDAYEEFVFNESMGLFFLEKLLHIFTYEPKVLFFVVAFIFMFVTLLAYRNLDEANPQALLLLLLSAYPTYGLYMLKQSLAVAIMFLAFSYYKKNKQISIICTIVAILFHESALVVIPVVLVLKLLKNNVTRKLVYIFSAIVLLGFANFNNVLISYVIKLVPALENQLSAYLNVQNGAIISNGTYLTFLKGIPFFLTFIVGLFNRKENENEKYNEYMFLTFFVSITFILSNYMYWLFRFGLYFYFPVFIFAERVLQNIKSEKNKMAYYICTYGLSLFLSVRLWCQYYFLYGGL